MTVGVGRGEDRGTHAGEEAPAQEREEGRHVAGYELLAIGCSAMRHGKAAQTHVKQSESWGHDSEVSRESSLVRGIVASGPARLPSLGIPGLAWKH